jgi:hypothetical protein
MRGSRSRLRQTRTATFLSSPGRGKVDAKPEAGITMGADGIAWEPRRGTRARYSQGI